MDLWALPQWMYIDIYSIFANFVVNFITNLVKKGFPIMDHDKLHWISHTRLYLKIMIS